MIRQEQCDKVCRILDDVLANRPTERDSLIVATRKAFEALEGTKWIPCSERLPEEEGAYLVTVHPKHVSANVIRVDLIQWDREKWMFVDYGGTYAEYPYRITAWMSLPDPWKGEEK